MKTKTLIALVLATLALGAGSAIALNVATVVVHGHGTPVRATTVGGQYYLNAFDLARALGNGASFDSNKKVLYVTPVTPRAATALGGWTSNGYLAVSIGPFSHPSTVSGNAPDPGQRFFIATMRLRNLTHSSQPLPETSLELLQGDTHLDTAQLFEANGAELTGALVPAGATATYRIVFEASNGAQPTGVLVHPPAGMGPEMSTHI